jgi:DNA-binding HxlR family transcriptional regulator
MDTIADAQTCIDLCEALPDGQEELTREVFSRVSGRWAMWVLHVLAEADGPVRFTRLLHAVEGITQKVLTQTLRQLERDGFVSRTVFPQVPPRVEYALTPLGGELLARAAPLWAWFLGQAGAFEAARRRFDAART